MSRIDDLIKKHCPDGVEYTTLGEICKLSRGRVMSKDYLRDYAGEYPVYSSQTASNGVFGRIKTYDYDGTFITWTTDGANAGSVFYRENEKFSITNVCGLISNSSPEKIDLKFLFYVLGVTAKGYVYSGMGNPKLMSNVMATISVPLPPLPVQQEIVDILDAFTKLEAELEAELEARQQQYAHYRYELLNFSEDEVEWKLLGDVAVIGTGNHDTQDAIEDGNYVFYARGRDPLKLDVFDFDETAIITAGDGAGVGKVFHYAQGKYALHQRAYRIVPSKIMEPRFVYHYLAAFFYTYIQKASVSSSVTSLRRPMFLNLPIPVPTLAEQQRIIAILDKFDALVNDISSGLPAEIAARRQQYEHYRNQLLTFRPAYRPPAGRAGQSGEAA